VLRVEDVEDDAGWSAVLTGDTAPDWVVMASPRAPGRFVEQCQARGAHRLLTIPVAVIGDGTAEAASAARLEPAVVGPGTGLGLADVLIRRLDEPARIVYACGHHRRPELPDALATAGHTVLPVVVYRMNATPPRELPPLGPGLEAVVVTSPRAAALYLDGVGGRPLPCQHWALGPTTRDAARSMGIECRIPAEPTIASLAEALCRVRRPNTSSGV
jgi:uroporphyrinogen-III synthase